MKMYDKIGNAFEEGAAERAYLPLTSSELVVITEQHANDADSIRAALESTISAIPRLLATIKDLQERNSDLDQELRDKRWQLTKIKGAIDRP